MTMEVRNLSFAYAAESVLKGISFAAKKGSLLCVLGKNGTGKSTMFRCILGLLKGYGGEILIDGMRTKALSAKELAAKVSYIPQHHQTTFSFSVLDMVMMGTTIQLRAFSGPGEKQKEVAKEALEMVNIGHLARRNFSRISGGEQQLALIARAIAQQAKIIIMDEPCSNLDYGNQIRVMKAVKDLSRKGYLIIQSTHNPEHVFLFADEVLVMMDGKAKAKGEPRDILTEKMLYELYGIQVSLYEIQQRKLKFCIPDEGEIECSQGKYKR